LSSRKARECSYYSKLDNMATEELYQMGDFYLKKYDDIVHIEVPVRLPHIGMVISPPVLRGTEKNKRHWEHVLFTPQRFWEKTMVHLSRKHLGMTLDDEPLLEQALVLFVPRDSLKRNPYNYYSRFALNSLTGSCARIIRDASFDRVQIIKIAVWNSQEESTGIFLVKLDGNLDKAYLTVSSIISSEKAGIKFA